MKSSQELKEAHDLLLAIISDRLPIRISRKDRLILEAQHRVLCFVLECEGSDCFQNAITSLRELLEKIGVWERQRPKQKALTLTE